MSLLDGGISALFGGVFGALYLDGTITQVAATDDGKGGGVEALGDPVPCKVQVDRCTEAMRREPGYTARDVRLIVLQQGVTMDLDTDCRVTVKGVTYDIGSVDVDPARSYWDCRGIERRA
jgi:hypothetical protein